MKKSDSSGCGGCLFEIFGELAVYLLFFLVGGFGMLVVGFLPEDFDVETVAAIGGGIIAVLILAIGLPIYFQNKRKRNNMKKIIFDTDIGGDCDDAGALAIIQEAQNNGDINLLAVTVSTRDPWAVGCADAVNRYYGNIVPIGLCHRAPIGDPTMEEFLERYGKHITENYENEYQLNLTECSMGGSTKYPEDAVKLYRKILSKNRGTKVTFVIVGSCLNLASLIESDGDKISPLTGLELIESQVDKIVLMGGLFAENATAEYNIKIDIPSAKTVFEKCPVPIYVSHFDMGLKIMTGGRLLEEESENLTEEGLYKNPVAESYKFHVGGKRHSWDPITSFYAIYGTRGVFSDKRRGRIVVDDEGITRLYEGEGNHILIDCDDNDIAAAEKIIDAAMCGYVNLNESES